MLDQITGPIASFTGDGAYDRDDVDGAVAEHRQIAERGRLGWQKSRGGTNACSPISAESSMLLLCYQQMGYCLVALVSGI